VGERAPRKAATLNLTAGVVIRPDVG
jgi:hypothetical protein